MAYGISAPGPDAIWQRKGPSELLDYTWNFNPSITDPVTGVVDPVVSVTVDNRPSGAGELAGANLTMSAGFLTMWFTGGVAARVYDVRIVGVTAAGRRIEANLALPMKQVLATWPLPTPPSTAFGSVITWTSGVTVIGSSILPVLDGLTGTGTNQATATLLLAQNNIATGGVVGGGFILPVGIVAGTFRFTNAWTSDQLMYPPLNAQIGAYGPNNPVAVGPNQTVDFATDSPASQWWAQ